MRVLVAMSGGVDSSVAAAWVRDAGHEVVGVTLKLWGGESDSGCCSISDVEDARRVADRLGIDHYVFNLGDDFTRHVVEPYVAAHAGGLTPNPCLDCNRHVKFDKLLRRAEALGFDAVATGHHARVAEAPDGRLRIARGADRRKDQSYVLYMLGQEQLRRILLPIGGATKGQVREAAAALGLRTAGKPDSQDVCFVTAARGRRRFLSDRIPLTPGRIVDTAGNELGRVDAVELVTVGQRKGLDLAGAGRRRYALHVDVRSATVVVGDEDDLLTPTTVLRDLEWADRPVTGEVLAQCSAHGDVAPAVLDGTVLRWTEPRRRVAPGQSVVLYHGDQVLGGGIAA